MPAQLQIDQTGLATGTAGVSRTDGLDTGALVTLTNTSMMGSTTTFYLLWVPPGDTTAVSSLAPTGPTTWTFTPTAGVYGTYLVLLVEDESLPSELQERRALVVRTPNRGLIVPALNEIGDSKASLDNSGIEEIEAADNNATDFANVNLNTVQYAAWWRALYEFITSLDDPDAVLSGVPPVDVTKAAAVVGALARASRADHKHDVSTAAPVNVTKVTTAEGAATSLARSDHKHDVSTASAGVAAAGDSALEGSATSLARSDHKHTFTGGSPVNVTKASAAEGVATTFSRSDHKHDITTAIASVLAIGDVAAEGSATTTSRSDHRHSVAVGFPVDVTRASPGDGVATSFSRSDHKHDITTAAPVAIGTSLQEGTSSSLARADHVHTIPPATASQDGYLSKTSIANAVVWTTSADIPTGNRFQFICTGAGAGGVSGSAQRGSGNFGTNGGPGGGGGARPPPYWFSRAFLVSQLPITFAVPAGGAGGAAVSRNTIGVTSGNAGGAPTSTTITGASGILAFAGSGSTGLTTGAAGTGGGCWATSVGTNTVGGIPDDGSSGSGANVFAFGGSATNNRASNGASGTQSMSRHGGGGGSQGGTTSDPSVPGGIAHFGGGGGAGGGGAGQVGFSPIFGQGNDGGGHDFTFWNVTPYGGGGGTFVTNGAGGAGPVGNDLFAGGGGAGGAGNSTNGATIASAGGAGGFPGGGGGGGGTAVCSSAAGATSGAGGNGGAGEILVFAFF